MILSNGVDSEKTPTYPFTTAHSSCFCSLGIDARMRPAARVMYVLPLLLDCVLFICKFGLLVSGRLCHSTASLLFVGYHPVGPSFYEIDISKLRRFHLGAIAVTLSIILMNLKLYGLPALFGFFGADTMNYQEYGSLRQILFTGILVLFVSAPLEVSIPRRWALCLYIQHAS
jgi:hypothetical protein